MRKTLPIFEILLKERKLEERDAGTEERKKARGKKARGKKESLRDRNPKIKLQE